MPEASKDALLAEISPQQIASLANLYDRFANALDPFGEGRDAAERVFTAEVSSLYDYFIGNPSVMSQRDFRREVIVRCKRHLRKN